MKHLKLIKEKTPFSTPSTSNITMYYWLLVDDGEEYLISDKFESEQQAIDFLKNYFTTSVESNKNTTIH